MNSKNWNWTQICCNLLLPKSSWKTFQDLEKKHSGNDFGQEIELTVSLLMHPETFSPECAVTSTENMTRERLGCSKKKSDVRNCYTSVARRTAVMLLRQTSLNSAVKASANVCYNSAAMVPWTNTAASWLKNNEYYVGK